VRVRSYEVFEFEVAGLFGVARNSATAHASCWKGVRASDANEQEVLELLYEVLVATNENTLETFAFYDQNYRFW
jgi:hypothetical protein